MKCLIVVLALIGCVAAAPAQNGAVDKCYELVAKEMSAIQTPASVSALMDQMLKENGVTDVEKIPVEKFKTYKAPADCKEYSDKLDHVFDLKANKICAAFEIDELDAVQMFEKLESTFRKQMDSSFACAVAAH